MFSMHIINNNSKCITMYHINWNLCVSIKWINSEELVSDRECEKQLDGVDGILVLPGFGDRGTEGKVLAGKYAREKKVPYLGICLGLQTAVIEFARHVCGLKKATSTEFKKRASEPVIDLMDGQKKVKRKGATMRLGAYNCEIKKDTLAGVFKN